MMMTRKLTVFIFLSAAVLGTCPTAAQKARRSNTGARNERGESRGRIRDWWAMTIGDTQYQWFKNTLEQSKARY